MLRLVRRADYAAHRRRLTARGSRTYSLACSSKQHDPLNILFCGADEFSIYSLRALHKLQGEVPEKIAAINVVCRPDKRVGRGLKKIQEVPIKNVASQLELELHQIDTFKGWSPPVPINLVIAVSFGLLVPSRILGGAKYGGLNVHPSMLPDLRGPAPIIHTLLKQRIHTGVTLQTMHPTRFDHGTILAQTPSPGVIVPPEGTPDELLKSLGPLGARLLCDGIESGIFVPPVNDIRQHVPDPAHIDQAPKVTPEDRHIEWCQWTADEVRLRDRVLGRLWDNKTYARSVAQKTQIIPRRITFQGPWTIQSDARAISTKDAQQVPGQPMLISGESPGHFKLGICTVDRQVVVPTAVTIEGEGKERGVPVLISALKSND